jgi:general secretion pathway protein I
MPHPHASTRAGLTLLEVLLALAIFLIAVVALAGLVDMGTDRELEAQMQVRAARLAQAKMGELVSGSLGGSLASNSGSSGTFDNDPDWSYTTTVSPAQTQVALTNLYTVQVEVTRNHRGQKFSYTLTQMAIDPYMMGTGQAATTTASSASATSALLNTGGAP